MATDSIAAAQRRRGRRTAPLAAHLRTAWAEQQAGGASITLNGRVHRAARAWGGGHAQSYVRAFVESSHLRCALRPLSVAPRPLRRKTPARERVAAHRSRVQLIGVPLVLVASRRASTAVSLGAIGSIVCSASRARVPRAAQPPRVDEHELPRAARREALIGAGPTRNRAAKPPDGRASQGPSAAERQRMPARGQRNLRCASASAAASPAHAPSCAQSRDRGGHPEGRPRTQTHTRNRRGADDPAPRTHPHPLPHPAYHRRTLKRSRIAQPQDARMRVRSGTNSAARAAGRKKGRSGVT